MSKSTDLQTALKSSDLSVQQYVVELEVENAKLHKKIAQLEVKNVSSNNRIIALQEEIKEAEAGNLEKFLKDMNDI